MADDTCTDCTADDRRDETTTERRNETTTDRWITDTPVLEAELPSDLQSALGRFVGADTVDTLGDWVTEVRRRTGGGSISLEELCHADAETAHWGELKGKRYYFACFYDAVILASLAASPVDVYTESPGGSVIEARAVGDTDLSVSPADAVFSFGIDDRESLADGTPTLEDAYQAICPYVRAFPDPSTYERWAETVPATTVGIPLAGATELAAALAERRPDERRGEP